MRSVCLEGYDYSVFDLTRLDRVQIQVWLQKIERYGSSMYVYRTDLHEKNCSELE